MQVAFTILKATDAPDGFANALKLTAQLLIHLLQQVNYNVATRFEGQDLQQLKKVHLMQKK